MHYARSRQAHNRASLSHAACLPGEKLQSQETVGWGGGTSGSATDSAHVFLVFHFKTGAVIGGKCGSLWQRKRTMTQYDHFFFYLNWWFQSKQCHLWQMHYTKTVNGLKVLRWKLLASEWSPLNQFYMDIKDILSVTLIIFYGENVFWSPPTAPPQLSVSFL